MQSQIQGFQLSPQQQRLWQLQETNQVYYTQCVLLIKGNIQLDVLRLALQKVVSRNEIFRTNFHHARGIKLPLQVIQDESYISIKIQKIELDNHGEDIKKLLQQDRLKNFDYSIDSPLRLSLIRLSLDKYLLLISLPALYADLGTLHNFIREIISCYTSSMDGRETLDEPLQYADIAAWQNELLEQVQEISAKSWRQPDSVVLKNLQLPSEKPYTDNQKFEPQFITLPIHQDLRGQLEAITKKYQSSLSGLFLTCWQILLWRLTGQSKLIMGLGVDGRNYEELKSALGLLAKYLPLDCDLQPDCKFNDLILQTEKSTDELTERQESFIWEVDTANEQFSFFPFCYEFLSSTKYFANNISFSICQQYACTDRFKVKLACCHEDNKLNIEFHYDANLLTTEAIQGLAEQFRALLTSVVQNPEEIIARLNILSNRERSQLLVEFNDTQAPLPKYQCIHHWFEEQCSRTPNNIAVIFGDQKLTYHQLNIGANQLANYLQQLGVTPDMLVGLCVERSPMMVIGLLGILKAGGAYVPIDPSYPHSRQAYILKDTQMPIVVTQQSFAENLKRDNLKAIYLDTDWDVIKTQPIENPVTSSITLNLAYVIYTSGSTGEPKGTLIPHQGLINYLNWCTQAYAVAKGSGTLVHSSLGFDLTITSLLAPLLVGNQVELLPESNNIENLSTRLKERSNLSLVKITPSHLKLLSQQISPQQAASRTNAFIIGGENLTLENIAEWQDFAPDTILVNEYGPTETVVGCCVYQVPIQHYSGSIPIGKPIANTQLYVLDSYLQPVPKGVIGELYIGGRGLALGYLNRPELTAEKFVPHPFSTEPGTRLYKTGDLVRFRDDGMLEFKGRIDEQVKIRGFRIELGEIESVLLQHPTIKDSVVTVHEKAENDQRLIAYIVLTQESSFSVGNLRKFLQQQLPEYMVPSVFITLKQLPLTQNGKINRQELPVPDKVRAEIDKFYVAPRNSTEDKIANIWTEILKLERISIHDNFFELGGHSLIVTQVISRLRDVFDVEIFVQQIFETPTIADLAVIVTQKLSEQTDEETLAQALAEIDLQDLN